MEHSDFHDIEIHALDPQSADQARGEVQRLARRLGVAVEFVQRF
jgi:adenylate cyclase class IV